MSAHTDDTVYTRAQQTARGHQEVRVTLTPDADKRKKVLVFEGKKTDDN